MSGKSRAYYAYLLRLWRVNSKGKKVWRASLEDSNTGHREGFSGLEDMIKTLEKRISRDDKKTDDGEVLDKTGNKNQSIN